MKLKLIADENIPYQVVSELRKAGYDILTMNFYVEQSGIPIPEFGTTALILSSALAASLFIMRRKRRR